MKFLFVASLHHPPPSQAGSDPNDGEPATFPPSQGQHFWVRSLTKMGHTCHVFWRSASLWPWARTRALRMTERPSAARALRALSAPYSWIGLDPLWRNRRLMQHARELRPDVIVMIGGNDVILPGTLDAIRRELRPVLVYACGTSPVLFSHAIERQAATLYDLVVANDQYHAIQWLELGAPRAEVLPLSGVDPDFHRRRDPAWPDHGIAACEIAFVGTLVPSRLYSRRVRALEALREFDLAIWSVHEVPVSLRAAYRGPALGEQMVQAIGSASIVVNPHGDFMRYGGNMRLFEACGVGTMQIVDDLPGVHRWFRVGTDLITYHDVNELRDQVAYYLSHPDERRRIASAGQSHVYAHHTYDHRMARLVELVQTIAESRKESPSPSDRGARPLPA